MLKYIIILLAILSGSHHCIAQKNNYSGNLGRSFIIKSKNASDIFDSSPAGSNLPVWGDPSTVQVECRLLKINVTGDYRDKLEAEVEYQGGQSATMDVFYADNQKKPIPQVSVAKVPLGQGHGLASFTIQLADSVKEGFELNTSNLKLVVHKGNQPPKYYEVSIGKNWNKPIDDAKLTVKTTATPDFHQAKFAATSPQIKENYNQAIQAIQSTNDLRTITNAYSQNQSQLNTNAEPISTPNSSSEPTTNDNQTALGFSSYKTDIFKNVYADKQIESNWEYIDFSSLLKDKNPGSDIYYFNPVKYALKYNGSNGYVLSVNVRNLQDEQDENILLSFTLSNKIAEQYDQYQNQLKYYAVEKKLPVKEINPIMINNARVKVNAQIFDVQPDDISISPVQNVRDDIRVEWKMNYMNYEELLNYLQNGSVITGEVQLEAANGSQITVPLEIGLSSKFSTGKMKLNPPHNNISRSRNQFPFPIKATKLYINRLEPQANNSSLVKTYSYSLSDQSTINPTSTLEIDMSQVDSKVLNDPLVQEYWIGYEIVQDKDFISSSIETLLASSNESKRKNIQVEALGVLKKYNADKMVVIFRSKQLDPRNKEKQVAMMTINSDGQSSSFGPFFTWSDSNLKYEYTIELISNEKTIRSGRYIQDSRPELFINQSVAQQILGF